MERLIDMSGVSNRDCVLELVDRANHEDVSELLPTSRELEHLRTTSDRLSVGMHRDLAATAEFDCCTGFAALPEPNRPMSGRFGEYSPLERIGEGGMGAVYKAHDSRLKRLVAVKVLHPDRMHRSGAIARFLREIEILGKLDSPNIVRAYDAGEIRGHYFLVMEFVDGLPLSEVISRLGPLRFADACEVIRQSAAGLHDLESVQMVHRDIKPSNLMVTPEGRVKILDLGVARSYGDSEITVADLTVNGQILGTCEYMAPEQATDVRNVDIRADIYSLGATLYEVLVGKAPYSRIELKTPYRILRAHEVEPIPNVLDSCHELPDEFNDVMRQFLAKEPSGRPQTAANAIELLEPFSRHADLQQVYRSASEFG